MNVLLHYAGIALVTQVLAIKTKRLIWSLWKGRCNMDNFRNLVLVDCLLAPSASRCIPDQSWYQTPWFHPLLGRSVSMNAHIRLSQSAGTGIGFSYEQCMAGMSLTPNSLSPHCQDIQDSCKAQPAPRLFSDRLCDRVCDRAAPHKVGTSSCLCPPYLSSFSLHTS